MYLNAIIPFAARRTRVSHSIPRSSCPPPGAVLQRFGQMGGGGRLLTRQIGDGPTQIDEKGFRAASSYLDILRIQRYRETANQQEVEDAIPSPTQHCRRRVVLPSSRPPTP